MMSRYVDITEQQSVCRDLSVLWFPFFYPGTAGSCSCPGTPKPRKENAERQGGSSQRWTSFTATASDKLWGAEQRNGYFLAEKKYLKPTHHLYGVFPSLIHALISGGCGHTSPLAVAEPAAEMSAACLNTCCCTPARGCCPSFTVLRTAPRRCSFILNSCFSLSCLIWLKRV